VEGVFPLKWTIFLEFQFFLGISAVFAGSVVTPLAFAALQSYQFHRCLFSRHNSISPVCQIKGF